LHRTPGNTGGKGREEELLSSFESANLPIQILKKRRYL
jgi:hypothetical protein